MNDLITMLGTRSSFPKLIEPAPDNQTLAAIFEAALRVPDHLQLRPWRFLSIRGEGRVALGKIFADADRTKNPNASDEELDKKSAKALRAPLIIVGICSHQPNEKVPLIEQQLSTGCVLHNIGLALHSLNFASIWRTGGMASDTHVNQALGLASDENIVGFLYVGSPDGKAKIPKPIEVSQYLKSWPIN